MKKLISFLIIAAILGGIAYFFLGNNMMMVTMFTQNVEKKVSISNNAYKKLSEYSGYNFTIKAIETEDGVDDTVLESEVLIMKDNETYFVKAELKYDEGDTTKTKTVYYEGTALQGTIYEVAGTESGDKVFRTGTLGDAFNVISNGHSDLSLEALINYESNKVTKEIMEESEAKAKITFSFSPFYIGLKFVESNEADGVEVIKTKRFDFGGTIRELIVETKAEALDTNYSIKINKPGKKVSFSKLTSEQKATFIAG